MSLVSQLQILHVRVQSRQMVVIVLECPRASIYYQHLQHMHFSGIVVVRAIRESMVHQTKNVICQLSDT
jgi:hypothetical protein